LSDFYPHGHVAECYGVMRPEGHSERAIFVIDKQGVIRYVDVHALDEQPDNELLFQVLGEIEPFAAARPAVSTPPPKPEPEADVVMYCTAWCPQCRRARAFFKDLGIALVEIDITRDREAAARVRSWANGFETTPTFKIKGQVLVGYDQSKLEKLLF
jgi:glutaredoxin